MSFSRIVTAPEMSCLLVCTTPLFLISEFSCALQIWRGFSGQEDCDHDYGWHLWIWAPQSCAMEHRWAGRLASFEITHVDIFNFNPSNYHTYELGVNIFVKMKWKVVEERHWRRSIPTIRSIFTLLFAVFMFIILFVLFGGGASFELINVFLLLYPGLRCGRKLVNWSLWLAIFQSEY